MEKLVEKVEEWREKEYDQGNQDKEEQLKR